MDTSAPLWAVCKVNDKYREADFLKPFDTITLVTKQSKESIEFKINGTGTNPAAVQTAVNLVNTGLNEGRQQVPQMAQQMPFLKPVADFVTSAKCDANGNDASFTATMPGNPNSLLAAPAFLLGMRAHAQPPPVAPIGR